MEDPFVGMFKLVGLNYSVWKLKVRNMLVCKDLWWLVQYNKTKPNNINVSTHTSELNDIHKVFHRHESIQQLQQGDKC